MRQIRDNRLALRFRFMIGIVTPLAVIPCSILAQNIFPPRLSGRVIDDSTGTPLAQVNVFIANTMIGAVTDQNGFYSITRAPLGALELVASMIGYEIQTVKIRLIDSSAQRFDFKLKPKALLGPQIEVLSSEPVKWKKKLKQFQELFLGASVNASACKILNPEVLDFTTDEETHTFTATAGQALQIENKALGYRLHFILKTFTLHEDELRYQGKAKFEPLDPANSKEMKKWEENRMATYDGSMQHCLAALAARRHVEEGFLIYRLSTLPEAGQNPRLIDVGIDDLISAGELSFERRLHFPDFLQIIYTRARQQQGFRPSLAPSLLRLSLREWRQGAASDAQISWIKLNQSPVVINTQGHLYNPLDVTTHGEWANERVADLLPWDYQPTDSALLKKIIPAVNDDFYAQGVQHRNAGDWKKALDSWLTARQAPTAVNKTDPRLGIAFIELATQEKAAEYYDAAGAMYFGGLSNANVNEYKDAMQKEIARIAPLLDEKQYSTWRQTLLAGDPSLFLKIKEFWIEQDPIPTTPANERLLEHWERIAYARAHFTKASNTAYGTDDRGPVYVRMGEPARKKTGVFGLNQAELRRWVINEQVQNPNVTSNTEIFESLREYNLTPEYEIWLYEIEQWEEPVIYLFGNKEGAGAFGLRNGVEDFIPERAFKRRSTRYAGAFLPGSLLQIIFYAYLLNFDPAFEKRYRELEAIWAQTESALGSLVGRASPNHHTLRGKRAHFQSADTRLAQRYASFNQSNYDEALLPIELACYPARFLDGNNQPQLAIYTFSYPRTNDQSKAAPASRLQHTLIIRDKNLEESNRLTEVPKNMNDHTTLLVIPHQERYADYTFVSERFGLKDSIFSQPIAVGKTALEIAAPLSAEPARLELSDLLIGVELPAEVERALFPFDLIPSAKIWRPDALKIYLEIYHLLLKPEDMAHFNIRLQVARLEGETKKLKKKAMVSIKFDLDSSTSTAKENLTINISQLKSGLYEIEADVLDLNSSQKKKRTARFQIVDLALRK